MAYINFKPQSYFNTVTYDGTATSGRAVTGVGFQPDLTWIKDRVGSNEHYVGDSVRGSTKQLITNTNAAEHTASQGLQSFDADGFTVGSDGDVNPNHGTSYPEAVSWNWKGGTTSVPSGGSITPTGVSRNTTAGFYCAKYSGNGTDNATLAHGLGKKPNFIVVKKLNATYNWANMSTAWNDNGKILSWTITNSLMTDDVFGNTQASSDYIYLNDNGYGNASGSTYVIYAWANIDGYFRTGPYMGNANVNGPVIYTGFSPAMVIIKRYDGSDGWNMWDNKRTPHNLRNKYLEPDYNGPEVTGTSDHVVDFLSNGFKIRGSGSETNTNGGNYVYMAWASNPIIGSNGTVGVAI